MTKTKKLVIVGDSAFAEIALEYFEVDTEYRVVAFSVEEKYLTKKRLHGLPVVDFETLERFFSPDEYDVFVAIVYTQMNRLRTRLMVEAKAKGFKLASYISPSAFVWRNVALGEHCFIFEDNTIQPFVSIGNNVVLWSGNHIGHHSKIDDNCFISSHVVISGFSTIGKNSFLGVNSTISNNINVAIDNWIGPSVTIIKNTGEGELYGAPPATASKISALRFFRVGPSR